MLGEVWFIVTVYGYRMLLSFTGDGVGEVEWEGWVNEVEWMVWEELNGVECRK